MSEPATLFDVAGKTACVTGASSGLGRHAANVLAAAGARVVGVARRAEQLERWSSEARGETTAVPFNLSDLDRTAELATAVSTPFGPPDILVHCAGMNTRQTADDVSLEGWKRTLDVNLSVPFFLSQLLVGPMKESGWGRIVNFASLQSFRAFPAGISYGASKGGVAQLTRAMAEAWSGDGINVNAIGPGFFKTELTEAVFADPERAERNAAQTCVGRNGALDDLDGPLLFLCSPASAFVTGQVLMVDGGFTAK